MKKAGSNRARMFLVDTVRGRIIDDEEIKAEMVGA